MNENAKHKTNLAGKRNTVPLLVLSYFINAKLAAGHFICGTGMYIHVHPCIVSQSHKILIVSPSIMTDNKLRCVLIYRVEESNEPTILASFDHASQYEAAGGAASDEASLYGGRDKSYAKAVADILKADPPASGADATTIGGFKVVQSSVHQVTYGADGEGRCVAVITGLEYPSRVVVQMITELHKNFVEKFGLMAMSATSNSLTKKSLPMIKESCKKYDDLTKVDKTSNVQAKIEEVKTQMQDNIALMLENTESAEELQDKSNAMNEAASVFKNQSKDLKKTMKWKNLKMTLILILVVLLVLAIILVPLILRSSATDDGS